jgi:broad specificity phosphatase PhoE
MKRFVAIAFVLLFTAAVAEAAPIVFVVRHAEKASSGGNDPDLSAAGYARADALARILKDTQITAVFVTEFKRTQETAAPTAKEAHATPTVVPANETAALITKLHDLKGGALVVGHTNTIPGLMKGLGITAPVNISDDDYTEIFVVLAGDPPKMLRLHYPF